MELRRFGLVDFVLLLIVLAGAGGARWWYISDQAQQASMQGPMQVEAVHNQELLNLVQNVHRHRWFGGFAPLADTEEQTAHVSPGYPLLLSVAAAWTDEWEPLVRWIQCGLGTLTAGLYFLFARRAFRSSVVGLLAGLFCAGYPFWIINTAELNDGVVATFLLAACMALGARVGQLGGATTSLLFGLCLAALALVRAPLLPFAVVALLWFLLRCRRIKRGWLYALLAFLGFTNGLVPWTFRNVQVFGDLVPIVDSAYLHLWIGNHGQADGGPLDPTAIPGRLAADLDKGDPAAAVKEVEAYKKLKQPERYNKLAHVVVDHIKRDPAGAVQRRLSAGLCFILGADWFKEHRLCAGEQKYEAVLAGTLLGMLLLAFLGWRWSYAWQYSSMPSSLAVIWIPIPYMLSHAEALSGPRLPLDGILLCYAALAVVWMLPGIGPFQRLGYDATTK